MWCGSSDLSACSNGWGQHTGLETYPFEKLTPFATSSDRTVGMAHNVSKRWSSVRIRMMSGWPAVTPWNDAVVIERAETEPPVDATSVPADTATATTSATTDDRITVKVGGGAIWISSSHRR